MRVCKRLVAAALLLGVGACDRSTGPLTGAGVPAELVYSSGGFGTGSASIELRGDTVVLSSRRWGWSPGQPVDSIRTVPNAEQWSAFWTAADRAGVHRWRREYMAEGVMDGHGWSLRLTAAGRQIRSHGSNAYPDRHGREHEMNMTQDFRVFRAALERLVGAPVEP